MCLAHETQPGGEHLETHGYRLETHGKKVGSLMAAGWKTRSCGYRRFTHRAAAGGAYRGMAVALLLSPLAFVHLGAVSRGVSPPPVAQVVAELAFVFGAVGKGVPGTAA